MQDNDRLDNYYDGWVLPTKTAKSYWKVGYSPTQAIFNAITFAGMEQFIVTDNYTNILQSVKAMKIFTWVSSSWLHNVRVDPKKWHEIKFKHTKLIRDLKHSHFTQS